MRALLRGTLPLLSLLAACGEDPPPPPPPPPTELLFTVTSAADGAPIAGADLTVDGKTYVTDAAGQVKLEVTAGAHPYRAQAAGHLRFPRPFRGDPSALAIAEKTTPITIVLEPRPGSVPGGTISGGVTIGGAPAANVLVVAAATTEYSAYTDSEGKYRLLGAAQGIYEVQAYLRGHSSSVRNTVNVTAGGEAANVDLVLTPAAGAAVGGSVGGGAGTTSVAITLAATGDPIPGASARVNLGSMWSIDGLAEGDYRAVAFLEDDGRVLDPDLIRTRDEPLFEVTGTASISLDLPSAPAIEDLRTDTSSAASGVRFSWSPLPEADFYVVEVSNVLGQVIWGGFDAMRRPVFRVLSRTDVVFGTTAQPTQMLQSGRRYRVRVFAGIETLTGSLFELIGASEELDGEFVAP